MKDGQNTALTQQEISMREVSRKGNITVPCIVQSEFEGGHTMTKIPE